MRVEVAYARPEHQAVIPVEVDEGATAAEAIERSGLLERFPDIVLVDERVGVLGRVRGLQARLREGDRVEIYRPLRQDPKRSRRRRAAAERRRG